MTRFGNAREAKEFLISRIAEQAQRDGEPLSEIERKELYFTESGWTLLDIMSVNEAFERDYDQDSYKKKIKKLVREARNRAREGALQDVKSWSDRLVFFAKRTTIFPCCSDTRLLRDIRLLTYSEQSGPASHCPLFLPLSKSSWSRTSRL